MFDKPIKASAVTSGGFFYTRLFQKGDDLIDTTYTFLFTPEQYAALLNMAAELDISLENLLLQAIQNQIKEDESHV